MFGLILFVLLAVAIADVTSRLPVGVAPDALD